VVANALYSLFAFLLFRAITVAALEAHSYRLWFAGVFFAMGTLSAFITPWGGARHAAPEFGFRTAVLVPAAALCGLWFFSEAVVWGYSARAVASLVEASRLAGGFLGVLVGLVWAALSLVPANAFGRVVASTWRIVLLMVCLVVFMVLFWQAVVYVLVGTGMWFKWLFSHF